jgi:hypothetical protein
MALFARGGEPTPAEMRDPGRGGRGGGPIMKQ